MVLIISFDCGTVNLGYSVVEVNPINYEEEIPKCNSLDDIKKLLRTNFKIIEWNNQNITRGLNLEDTEDQDRAKDMKDFLNDLDNRVGTNDETIVLVEYQMGPNDKSRGVAWQLIYHYDVRVIKVGPSLKNQITFDPLCPYQYFLQKYGSRKYANKKHTRHQLIKYLEITGQQDILPDKKKLDDAADSFLQILGYYGHINNGGASITKSKSKSKVKAQKSIKKKNSTNSKVKKILDDL